MMIKEPPTDLLTGSQGADYGVGSDVKRWATHPVAFFA